MKITRTVELSVTEAEQLLSKFDNGATYKVELPARSIYAKVEQTLYFFLKAIHEQRQESEYAYSSSKISYIRLARHIYPGLTLAAAKYMVENTNAAMAWINDGFNPNEFKV